MKIQFSGPLAISIERHLQLRRSLGFSYDNAAFTLARFDRYLAQHFPVAKTVTKQILEGFLETTRQLAPQTRKHQLSDLRQFCRFLFQWPNNCHQQNLCALGHMQL